MELGKTVRACTCSSYENFCCFLPILGKKNKLPQHKLHRPAVKQTNLDIQT